MYALTIGGGSHARGPDQKGRRKNSAPQSASQIQEPVKQYPDFEQSTGGVGGYRSPISDEQIGDPVHQRFTILTLDARDVPSGTKRQITVDVSNHLLASSRAEALRWISV